MNFSTQNINWHTFFFFFTSHMQKSNHFFNARNQSDIYKNSDNSEYPVLFDESLIFQVRTWTPNINWHTFLFLCYMQKCNHFFNARNQPDINKNSDNSEYPILFDESLIC